MYNSCNRPLLGHWTQDHWRAPKMCTQIEFIANVKLRTHVSISIHARLLIRGNGMVCCIPYTWHKSICMIRWWWWWRHIIYRIGSAMYWLLFTRTRAFICDGVDFWFRWFSTRTLFARLCCNRLVAGSMYLLSNMQGAVATIVVLLQRSNIQRNYRLAFIIFKLEKWTKIWTRGR